MDRRPGFNAAAYRVRGCRAARVFGLPTVLTTVATDRRSGTVMPEATEFFPGLDVIDRTSINSWLDPTVREAIAQTGRKRIVLAGLGTGPRARVPSLDRIAEGFEISAPTDACGDLSVEAHERVIARPKEMPAQIAIDQVDHLHFHIKIIEFFYVFCS